MDGGNRQIGAYVWIGAGLLFGLAGAALLVASFQLAGRTQAENTALEAQCLQRLQTMGTATRQGDHLRLEVPQVDSPRVGVEDASALSAVCPGWTLSYFCMGSACGGAATGGRAVHLMLELAPAN